MTVERIPLAEEPIRGVKTVAAYDAYAGLYIKPEYKYFVWKILRLGIRSGRVLDIGTGTGRLAIELARAKKCKFDIVGVDLSADMLQRAHENARLAGVGNQIDFVLSSGSSLPFMDNSFDLIVSYASLHHWLSPVKVLNEAYRTIKENGAVIIRDNRRVYGNIFWETFINLFALFQNRENRKRWAKALFASYTVSELQAITKESKMRNYRIYNDFLGFDLSLEMFGKV